MRAVYINQTFSSPLEHERLTLQGRLQHERRSNRNHEAKVRGTRLKQDVPQRCGTTALAVVGDVVGARSDFEDGAFKGALIVEVDEEEVWWAVPIACDTFVS